MLKTIKHRIQGMIFGILVTILVIGCMHARIDFRIDPDARELQQTERLDKQLVNDIKKIRPARKP